MIVQSLCNFCLQSYEVTITPDTTGLLKEIFSENAMCACPRQCGGQINLTPSSTISEMVSDPRLRAPIKLTVFELLRATKGAGLPDEIPGSAETVEALLLAHPVKKVVTQTEGKNIYLNQLHLSNGVVVHLCSGPHGAAVLKITKEKA